MKKDIYDKRKCHTTMYEQIKCSKISKRDCKILDDNLHPPFNGGNRANEKRQSGQLLENCDKKVGLLNTHTDTYTYAYIDTDGFNDLDFAKLSRSNSKSKSKSKTNQQQSSSTNLKSINGHCADTNGVMTKSSRKTTQKSIKIKMPKWSITLALIIYIVIIIPCTITPVMGKPTSTSTAKPQQLVKNHHHHHHHQQQQQQQQQKQQNKERDKLVEKSRSSNIEYEMEMERLKKVEESIQQSLESVASLSIVRSLDILRHNWLLEVNKNKKRTAQNKKAAENKAILDQIG